VARAFIMPAASALGPMLVPIDLLPRAIAWNSLGVQGGMVLGPWIGGVLCGISSGISYAAAAGMYLAAIGAFLTIRGNTRPQHHAGSRLTMIREGLAYIWSNKVVFGAISLDLVAVLLGGVTALLPVYAHDILSIGPDGFGLLRSGPAIGGGLMALLLSFRPIHRYAGPWMLGGVLVFGVATIVFAVSRDVMLSMTALVILGAADVISVFIRQNLVQLVTPDVMRGRVSAVSGLFISASNELGEFESGVAARLLGPIGSALLGGLGSMAVTLLWAKLFPALRKADRLEAPR
jgi:MFS family permease